MAFLKYWRGKWKGKGWPSCQTSEKKDHCTFLFYFLISSLVCLRVPQKGQQLKDTIGLQHGFKDFTNLCFIQCLKDYIPLQQNMHPLKKPLARTHLRHPNAALCSRTGQHAISQKSTVPYSTLFKVPDDFEESWNELKFGGRRDRACKHHFCLYSAVIVHMVSTSFMHPIRILSETE